MYRPPTCEGFALQQSSENGNVVALRRPWFVRHGMGMLGLLFFVTGITGSVLCIDAFFTARAVREFSARTGERKPSSEGEVIYTSGRDSGGNPVAHSGGPEWFGGDGGGCADCHGGDARGRTVGLSPTEAVRAADITFESLSAKYRGSAGGDGTAITDAIVEMLRGPDRQGRRSVAEAMPAWRLTEDQARSVAEYIRSL